MLMNVDAFLGSLKYMGYGLAGIFTIILVLIGIVMLLRKIFPAR